MMPEWSRGCLPGAFEPVEHPFGGSSPQGVGTPFLTKIPYEGIQVSKFKIEGSWVGCTRASIDCHMNCSKSQAVWEAGTSVGSVELVSQASSAAHSPVLGAAAFIFAEDADEQATSERAPSARIEARMEDGSGLSDMNISSGHERQWARCHRACPGAAWVQHDKTLAERDRGCQGQHRRSRVTAQGYIHTSAHKQSASSTPGQSCDMRSGVYSSLSGECAPAGSAMPIPSG